MQLALVWSKVILSNYDVDEEIRKLTAKVFISVNEGYGDDNQKTLEPFPFSQPVEKGKEEDAELRRQLKQMGKGKYKLITWFQIMKQNQKKS